MSIKVKSPPSPTPLLKNAAAAPVVFFDSAPMFGTMAGVVEVELATRILMPTSSGGITGDALCVGHLRCSPQAALSLIDALTKAADMLRGPAAPEARPETRTH